MTVEQYLGLFLLFEFDGYREGTDPADYIKDVTGYQLFIKDPPIGSNAPYCSGDACQNGVFNFLSAYQGNDKYPGDNLMLRRFTTLEGTPRPDRYNLSEDLATAADKYGNDVFNNKTMYENGDPHSVPWNWGNDQDEDATFRVLNASGVEIYSNP